jgi:predicted nuclease of restriction endonuclease-like RecB superfamily
VEIVGFGTSDYLQHKLATYRAARLPRVILCIDAKRSVEDRDLPAHARIVRFTKSIVVEQILAIINSEAGAMGRANDRQTREVTSPALPS